MRTHDPAPIRAVNSSASSSANTRIACGRKRSRMQVNADHPFSAEHVANDFLGAHGHRKSRTLFPLNRKRYSHRSEERVISKALFVTLNPGKGLLRPNYGFRCSNGTSLLPFDPSAPCLDVGRLVVHGAGVHRSAKEQED